MSVSDKTGLEELAKVSICAWECLFQRLIPIEGLLAQPARCLLSAAGFSMVVELDNTLTLGQHFAASFSSKLVLAAGWAQQTLVISAGDDLKCLLEQLAFP